MSLLFNLRHVRHLRMISPGCGASATSAPPEIRNPQLMT
jgi:hypothetical protein